MSAAAAAKQRLDDLHQQLEAYKKMLSQQEQDLYRLKAEMSQTRTVVQVTIPTEIGKASKEYACTMSYYKCQDTSQHKSNMKLAVSWLRDNLDLRFDSMGLITVSASLLVQFLRESWSKILVFMIGLFAAAILFPSHPSYSS
ncbi:hypothetical protein N0V82_005817 [Gnomoniopsis sp. IMI 355080]|nr:hypothetical protein N0V82_005817 [Gnomoniopsis sp. IMI 355080]